MKALLGRPPCGAGPRVREPQPLTGQIVSRLGAGVVDSDLKHRKPAFQFDRAAFCAFLGAELGLQSSIDFKRETGFWQFDRSAGHSESKVIGRQRVQLVTVSPARPTSLFRRLWKE
jgi:hypothetical protein